MLNYYKVYIISYSIYSCATSFKDNVVVSASIDKYRAKKMYENAINRLIKEYGLVDIQHKEYDNDKSLLKSVAGISELSRLNIEVKLSQYYLQ